MKDYELSNRRYVIGGVATFIVVVYIIRLFTLQIMSDDYKKNADSNAFLKRIDYPSRGIITDRKGRLMVYNQPAYDILVVMNEARGRLDTMEFCRTVGMTKEEFVARMDAIKDRSKNPGYSRFTQQLFMGQIPDKEFSQFREKIFRFPGFYIQKRSVRQYEYPYLMQASDGRLHLAFAYQNRRGVKWMTFSEQDVMGEKRETVGVYNPTAARV